MVRPMQIPHDLIRWHTSVRQQSIVAGELYGSSKQPSTATDVQLWEVVVTPESQIAKSLMRGRQRQRRSQCEAERRLGRNLNLLVPGGSAADEARARPYKSTDARTLTSSRNASY